MRNIFQNRGRQWLKPMLALALAGFLLPHSADAGRITVIGDTNSGISANWAIFDNILGGSKTVAFSHDLGQLGGLNLHYSGNPGVTTSVIGAPITASSLAGVDLLYLTAYYNTGPTLTGAEIATVSNFLNNAGDVVLMAEASSTSLLSSYNDLLAGLGTSIRYTGLRHSGTTVSTNLPNMALTEGATQFTLNHFNSLTGGKTVVPTAFGAGIATQKVGITAPVPAPSAGLALGGALVLLGGLRRTVRRRAALGGAQARS